jgi:hypothetical protein
MLDGGPPKKISSAIVRRFGIREIASERQKVESKRPSRATVLPGEETPRGK